MILRAHSTVWKLCVLCVLLCSSAAYGDSTIYEADFDTPGQTTLSGLIASAGEPYALGWSFASTNNGLIEIRSAGSHGKVLRMDSQSSHKHYSLNEAILTLDLSNWWDVGIEFDEFDYNDEEDPLPLPVGSSFTGSYEGDGLSISGDGHTWYTVWTPTYDHNHWKSHSFDLEPFIATIVSQGNNRGNIQLKFQQWDNVDIPDDGRKFDNILLQGTYHEVGGGDPVVPEPTSLSLLGLGALLMTGHRLRRRRRTVN